MKIRIEGCTAEELAEQAPYLSLAEVYEAKPIREGIYEIIDADGDTLRVRGCRYGGCAFLPENGEWIEVTE